MKKHISRIILPFLVFVSILACDEEFIIPVTPSLPSKSSLSSNPPPPPPSPYEGIWRMGNSSYRVKLSAPPNSTATYCEGSKSYPGTMNWTSLKASFQFQEGNCVSLVYITFVSDGSSFNNATYESLRTPQCSQPNMLLTYVPVKVTSGCN
jgi:hypothetical protein